VTATFVLRRYEETDEAVAIALWHDTWQQAYPTLDFAARLDWWRERWRRDMVPVMAIVVAEMSGDLVGFVALDPATGYLDQIVVRPDLWGAGLADALLRAAMELAPDGLELHVNQDNARALRFYRKHGFVVVGEETNPRSGAPVYRMSWRSARRTG